VVSQLPPLRVIYRGSTSKNLKLEWMWWRRRDGAVTMGEKIISSAEGNNLTYWEYTQCGGLVMSVYHVIKSTAIRVMQSGEQNRNLTAIVTLKQMIYIETIANYEALFINVKNAQIHPENLLSTNGKCS